MRRLLYEPHQKVKAFWPSSLPRLLRFRRVGLSVACSLMWFSRVPFLWAPGRGLYAKQSSQQPNVPAGQVIFLPLCAVSSTVQSASLPLPFPPLPPPLLPQATRGGFFRGHPPTAALQFPDWIFTEGELDPLGHLMPDGGALGGRGIPFLEAISVAWKKRSSSLTLFLSR